MEPQSIGQALAIVRSENPPLVKYIIWAQQTALPDPEPVVHKIYDFILEDWVLMSSVNEFWLKFNITFDQFAAAALEKELVLVSLTAGAELEAVVVKPTTKMDGPGIASATIKLGKAGDDNKYLFAPFDVNSAVGEANHTLEKPGIIESWDNATDILIKLTTTGVNTDQLNEGELEVRCKILQVK